MSADSIVSLDRTERETSSREGGLAPEHGTVVSSTGRAGRHRAVTMGGGAMNRKALLEAFRIATDKEREAESFYTELAEKADDPQVKQLFHRFAGDEASHSDALKEMYQTLRNKVAPGD
jgi:Rubrerythrin